MKVVIFGASGMVGQGVLREAIDAADVDSVVVVGRSAVGLTHAKVSEQVVQDLFDVSAWIDRVGVPDACFFCLGVSGAGLDEAEYRRLTYDLTVLVADALKAKNPGLTFVYVSGAGTDSSAAGKVMWARLKGATENAVIARFERGYAFRPAYIHPAHGEASKTYGRLYLFDRLLSPLFKLFGDKYWSSTDRVGRAMLRLAREGGTQRVLESVDIGRLGRAA